MAPMKKIPQMAYEVRRIILKDSGFYRSWLIGDNRGKEVVRARKILAWICINKLKMSRRQTAIMCGWKSTASSGAAADLAESGEGWPDYHYGEQFKEPTDYAMDVYRRACAAQYPSAS